MVGRECELSGVHSILLEIPLNIPTRISLFSPGLDEDLKAPLPLECVPLLVRVILTLALAVRLSSPSSELVAAVDDEEDGGGGGLAFSLAVPWSGLTCNG